MEKDVISGHGGSRFLNEKFRDHSDGFVENICACGKPAIVNHRERMYKCKYCGDMADIKAIPTTWSSKLLFQEAEATNIGIRRVPMPFVYEKNDTEDRAHSIIGEYSDNTIKELLKQTENASDDQMTINAMADE